MFNVVSQLPTVIWPSMTLMLALLVFVSWPEISSMKLSAVGNLPEINLRGRLMFEISRYECTVLGVNHES